MSMIERIRGILSRAITEGKLKTHYKALMACECRPEDLVLHVLHGPKYGGEWECLTCGKRSPARVVN